MKNGIDWLPVVNFTSLLQLVNNESDLLTNTHKHSLFGWCKTERSNSAFSRIGASQVGSEQVIPGDTVMCSPVSFFRENVGKDKGLFGF